MIFRFTRFAARLSLPGVFALLSLFGVEGLFAQVPLVVDAPYVPPEQDRIVLDRKVQIARTALRTGLPSTAAVRLRELLEVAVWTDAERAGLMLDLAEALIAGGELEAARKELRGIPPGGRGDIFRLHRLSVEYLAGEAEPGGPMGEALGAIDPDRLPPEKRAWFHFLWGIEESERGAAGRATAAFARASSLAASDLQKAYFDALRFREKLRVGPTDEETASELRSRWERFKGDAASYPYAREYAVVLYNLGKTDEAVAVINEELRNEESEYGSLEREQFLLLLAMITGVGTENGESALRELVQTGRHRETMSLALALLARSLERPDDEEFAYFLNQLISQESPHPLLGQLYLLRSQLALQRAEQARDDGAVEQARAQAAIAEADAQRLLERFPGMRQINEVYRLLAYSTLRRSPAQYRVAADYLTRLRDQTENLAERAELNRLIGDCYFLNEDFSNAADFYEAARVAAPDAFLSEGLFLRLVSAELRAGLIESALRHVDQADFSGQVPAEERWQVEWNVARALQEADRTADALERVRLLIGEGEDMNVPAYLDLRLRWLLLRLRLENGESGADLEAASNRLFERVRAIPSELLPESELALLTTEIGLLRAKVLIASGSAEAGLDALQSLRAGFPLSSVAERSYIVEAQYFTGTGDFERAQERLTELASKYPQSKFAAEALFEAAVNSERRGPDGFANAVRLLDLIGRDYPESPLLFHARLRQGDLLRSMSEFGDAQIIYENLINRFPEHPRRYLAEIARVDCIMALARGNPGPWEDAVIALERLLDLPQLPVDFQVEAGYKLGFALSKREESDQAREVFLALYTRYLADAPDAGELGAPGRYWMSRILLHLAELLEESGQYAEAKRIYSQIIAYNLPGRGLAQTRARSI